jgi:hypothetical protein
MKQLDLFMLKAFGIMVGLVLVSPVCAQSPQGMLYQNVPGHEPIWQVSREGGYYDSTGGIPGTVAAKDLKLYGGRYADGRPVSGAPKRRDEDGMLINESDYPAYRQYLVNRINYLTQLRTSPQFNSMEAWQKSNITDELASLNQTLTRADAGDRKLPSLPAGATAYPGYQGYPAATSGSYPVNGYPSYADANGNPVYAPGYPAYGQAGYPAYGQAGYGQPGYPAYPGNPAPKQNLKSRLIDEALKLFDGTSNLLPAGP